MLITHDLGRRRRDRPGRRRDVRRPGRRDAARSTRSCSPRSTPTREGLLGSIPSKGKRGQRLNVIKGTVANPFNMPPGCNFTPRCPYAFEPCPVARPADRGGRPAGRRVLALHAGRRASRAPPRQRRDRRRRSRQPDRWSTPGYRARRRRAATAPPPESAANRSSSSRTSSKYFPIHGGILRRKVGDVKAVDDVSFDDQPRARSSASSASPAAASRPSAGRSIRLLPRHRRDGHAQRRGHLRLKGDELKKLRRRMQIIFQDPVGSLNPRMPISDIIGEGLLAQADKENGWGDRKVRDKRVGGLPRRGRPAARLRPALPARVLGRPAPAHRHRPGARARPRVHRLRRAGLRARRLDPVADPQPARSTCGPSSTSPTCSSPTTCRSSSTSATGSG